jgi:hypothetical protein
MHEIVHDVPQGLNFGPLLFLLYINDLRENVQGAKLVLFEDDIDLLITSMGVFNLQHKIVKVIRELEIWFHKNKLKINTEKKNAM